jgi:chromosome partitioning protein
MPVISFANTKGGAGKTTAALLLATELARSGHRVTILDADPQHWISRWSDMTGAVQNLQVISEVNQSSIETHLRENDATTDYFIIDLPGSRTPLLSLAIGISDYIFIPVQGSAMDARGGAEVLEHIEFLSQRLGKFIPHAVVLTRVSPMINTRSLLLVKGLMAKRDVDVLNTPIAERSAFRELFDFGGTLETLDPKKVSNLDKAKDNAKAFARDILAKVPPRASFRPRHYPTNGRSAA